MVEVTVDRVIGAVTSGRQVDAVVNGSETLSKVAKPYLNGEKDILALAAGAIAGLGSEGMANLTLAGLLTALAGQLVAHQITAHAKLAHLARLIFAKP